MILTRTLLAAVLLLAVTGRSEAACQMNKVATLHVILEDNRILVPGKINGTAVKFILATDIESLILPGPAHDLGLLTMVGARLEPIIYAEEMGVTGPIKVSDLTLDNLHIQDMVMHTIGRRMNFGKSGEVAVIGRDFLLRYDVEFNLAAGEVNLFHSEGCDGTNLAYWTEHYNVLEMEHHLRTVRVKATVNGRPVIADINSGNPYTALSIDTAYQLGQTPSTKGVAEAEPSRDFLANDPIKTWDATFDSFSIDQENVRPVTLRIRKLTQPPPILHPYRVYWDSETGYARPEQQFVPGHRLDPRGSELSLGVDFIRTHRMLIAYSQRLVYFSHVTGEPFLEPSRER